jgi:hypothetical protein
MAEMAAQVAMSDRDFVTILPIGVASFQFPVASY